MNQQFVPLVQATIGSMIASVVLGHCWAFSMSWAQLSETPVTEKVPT